MAKASQVLKLTRKHAVAGFKRHKKLLVGVLAGVTVFVLDAVLSNAISEPLISVAKWLLAQRVSAVGLIWFVLVLLVVLGIIIHAYVVSHREMRKKPPRASMEERVAVDELRRVFRQAGMPAINQLLRLIVGAQVRWAERNRLASLLNEKHDRFLEAATAFETAVVRNVNCRIGDSRMAWRDFHRRYLHVVEFLHGIMDDDIWNDPAWGPEYRDWSAKNAEYMTLARGLMDGSVYRGVAGIEIRTDFERYDPTLEHETEESVE